MPDRIQTTGHRGASGGGGAGAAEQAQNKAKASRRLPSMVRHGSLIAGVVAALVLASSAMAQSVETYGGKGGQTQGQLGGEQPGGNGQPGQAVSAAARGDGDGGGALPFTGLDLALTLGGGLVLLGVGASMAKLTPKSPQLVAADIGDPGAGRDNRGDRDRVS